ncbi:hypothetical protein [Cellvibrio fibrivorans]|uniref:GspL cytoplasmic actin-ATPase-like domain-containing protein n=1 Tax=Cellvibrio fibrivorans TaxID=126350 RepID=A0ABU1V2S3_9GAMM|nr:hypothetical protein [Cellvibrio fibrivorans]MDR7091756.1 hypothetical protein [Cellvibrio fibrivorans]
MNELQRQAYLSALGIENYAPRWLMPSAPVSVACVLPVYDIPVAATPASLEAVTIETRIESKPSAPNVLAAMADLGEQKKAPLAINAAVILQQLEEKKAPVVQPFSLSVYRPQPGFLIIDSRNTKLALPTEVLLNNLLRVHLKAVQPALGEEVLRWPMIENRFVSRTEDDARNELQTWLAVENELRPIHKLWLMGESAARYWLDASRDLAAICWTAQPIKDMSLQALILPSLNQLLQNPTQKSRLWACLP